MFAPELFRHTAHVIVVSAANGIVTEKLGHDSEHGDPDPHKVTFDRDEGLKVMQEGFENETDAELEFDEAFIEVASEAGADAEEVGNAASCDVEAYGVHDVA